MNKRKRKALSTDRTDCDSPGRLSTETVEGSSLPLERVDDVERGHSLSLGVLGVGDRVSDDVLEATPRVSACWVETGCVG